MNIRFSAENTDVCVFGSLVIAFFFYNFFFVQFFSFNRAAVMCRRLCLTRPDYSTTHTHVCFNLKNRIYTRNREKRSAVKLLCLFFMQLRIVCVFY